MFCFFLDFFLVDVVSFYYILVTLSFVSLTYCSFDISYMFPHGLLNTQPYFLHSRGQKKPIREKKKRNRKRSKDMLKKLNETIFFLYYQKISYFSFFFCFQSNSNKRYCLHSVPKVSNKTKF